MTWGPNHRRPELSNEIEPSDVARPARNKKKIKKRFGVEWLGPRLHFNVNGKATTLTWSWVLWKWYATEKQRDNALVGLIKSVCNVYKNRPDGESPFPQPPDHDGPRYRKVDR
jgi:hypothetical protein